MRKSKFEIVEVSDATLTIDISRLLKTDELYFNATEMAKAFDKRVQHYLSSEQTKAYVAEIKDTFLKAGQPAFKIKKGRYGGTWMHHKLALDFARWLSPKFAVRLDRFTEEKLKEAALWRVERSEAKTGFLPMTEAIERAHDPVKFYHFSNEADLINRIVFGKTARQIRDQYDGASPRDLASVAELATIKRLQIINTGLIEAGFPYDERKEHLERCYLNDPLLVHDE